MSPMLTSYYLILYSKSFILINNMAQTFPGQHEAEEIDFVFRQHPIVMRKHMIFGLLIFALGLLPFAFWPLDQWTWWVAGIGTVIGLIIFGYRYLSWHFSVYIISSERLLQITQKGLFDRSVQDISLNRILSVNYEVKGLQATLFKFGTVVVQTYAGDLILKFIYHPEEVQQHLNKLIRDVTPIEPADLERGRES